MSVSMPAAIASSAAYWIRGLSTIGSNSFGIALVAGRKRVPKPATGKTALRNFMTSRLSNIPCRLLPRLFQEQGLSVNVYHENAPPDKLNSFAPDANTKSVMTRHPTANNSTFLP